MVRTLPHRYFTLLLITLFLSGSCLYYSLGPASVESLIFVLAGWLVATCFHEFIHALVAWTYGDYTVTQKGYLTLNPTRYVNGPLSLVLPMISLIFGGIGLPGAAVQINASLVGSTRNQAVIAAAGPLASAAAFMIVLSVYTTVKEDVSLHAFRCALALLAFALGTSVVLNLLPIPGLDGYAVLRGFTPSLGASKLRLVGSGDAASLAILSLVLVVAAAHFIGPYLWQMIELCGVNSSDIGAGLTQFAFWKLPKS